MGTSKMWLGKEKGEVEAQEKLKREGVRSHGLGSFSS